MCKKNSGGLNFENEKKKKAIEQLQVSRSLLKIMNTNMTIIVSFFLIPAFLEIRKHTFSMQEEQQQQSFLNFPNIFCGPGGHRAKYFIA